METSRKKPASIAAAGFVAKVVEDPASPPAVVLLWGYPGASPKDGHSRFYLSPELSYWIDVPTDGVVHVQEAAGERNPFGAVAVWVRQDAKVSGGNRWSTGA